MSQNVTSQLSQAIDRVLLITANAQRRADKVDEVSDKQNIVRKTRTAFQLNGKEVNEVERLQRVLRMKSQDPIDDVRKRELAELISWATTRQGEFGRLREDNPSHSRFQARVDVINLIRKFPMNTLVLLRTGPFKGGKGRVERVSTQGISIRFLIEDQFGDKQPYTIPMSVLQKNTQAIVRLGKDDKPKKQQQAASPVLMVCKHENCVDTKDGFRVCDQCGVEVGVAETRFRPEFGLRNQQAFVPNECTETSNDNLVCVRAPSTNEEALVKKIMELVLGTTNRDVPKKVFQDIEGMKQVLEQNGVNAENPVIMNAMVFARMVFWFNQNNPVAQVNNNLVVNCAQRGKAIFSDHEFLTCVGRMADFLIPLRGGTKVVNENTLVMNFVKQFETLQGLRMRPIAPPAVQQPRTRVL